MSERDVGRFSEWGSSYEEHWLQPRFFEPVQRASLRRASLQVPRPRRVLDVGCGTGALLRQAREWFPEAKLTGIDPARGMIRTARQRWEAAPAATFANATAEQLPFAGESFDLVLSTISFHHWQDQQAGLSEIRRVLAPGGVLVLTDIVAVAELRLLFAIGRSRNRFHTRGEIEEMFRRARLLPAGFEVAVRTFGIRSVSSLWGVRL